MGADQNSMRAERADQRRQFQYREESGWWAGWHWSSHR